MNTYKNTRNKKALSSKYSVKMSGYITPVLYNNYDIQEAIMLANDDFAKRLYSLRTAKKVSAREMSLSLGQGNSYITNIENGKHLPSMKQFFSICEFLNISPAEFFEYSVVPNNHDAYFYDIIQGMDSNDKELVISLIKRLQEGNCNAR